MRIAFVTETWLPAVDGVVTRLTATIEQLRAVGHEIMVVAPRGEDMHFPGVHIRAVPTFGFRWLYGGKRWGLPVREVGRAIDEFDPDIVHVVNPVLVGAAGVSAARKQGRPLVASYHTDLSRYAGHYHLRAVVPLLWAQLRRLHGQARVNLATSDAAARQLSEHGIENVAVWPRGVDLQTYHPPRRPRPGNPPVATYVGRIASEKGLHRLAPLTEPDSGVRLKLVGDGPAYDELRARFGPMATFTGTLRGRELAAAYRDADVFVFPSTTDTLGLVLLEALASGLPVVAANSPASIETLTGCASTRFFDEQTDLPGLVHELLSSAPRPVLRGQARAHAERWGWQDATAGLLEHYHQVLAHQPVNVNH